MLYLVKSHTTFTSHNCCKQIKHVLNVNIYVVVEKINNFMCPKCKYLHHNCF